MVNALDFNAVATNFGSGSGKGWIQGDFNYDGVVNTADFTVLSQDFSQVLPSPVLGTLVPEPSVMLVLGFGSSFAAAGTTAEPWDCKVESMFSGVISEPGAPLGEFGPIFCIRGAVPRCVLGNPGKIIRLTIFHESLSLCEVNRLNDG